MYRSLYQIHLFVLLIICLAQLSHCASTAAGPTAYVSIASAEPFTTMRPCAAGCLVFSGVWVCGVNSGYHDLGIELSCGCSPQNFCYCDPKAAASASSYISSCVNAGCGTEFPGEVSSAIDLYDGYCTTANLAVQTTASEVSPVTSSKNTQLAQSTSKTISSSANGAQATVSGEETTETSIPETPSTASKKKGLSQSDVIALAVGLGVGLPSLLLALATFCLQRKKKEKEHRITTEVHYVK